MWERGVSHPLVERFYQHGPFCILNARGGGGTQIWFRRGCAAEAAKPVPIFKGHFGGKGYPLSGVFIQEIYVLVYFSDEMGENIYSIYSNITNYTPCLGIFRHKTIPHV